MLLDESDRLAGYSIASRPDPCRAHLHRLVIAEEHRGKGLGTDLLNDLKSRARSAGYRRLSLKVGEDNLRAKRLYLSMGFALDDDSEPYHWMSEPLANNLIVACHQPNFLPWGGYFAKLIHCDRFVLLDDVQMPGGGSYVSRTKIAGPKGGQWMTVPISRKFGQQIRDVAMSPDPKWRDKHISMLQQVYAQAPYVDEFVAMLRETYEAGYTRLLDFNMQLLKQTMAFVGLRRELVLSSDMEVTSTGDQRLIELVQRVDGDTYLSGKGGQSYQDPVKFSAAGIDLNVREYQPVSYLQGADEFVPGLSIVDLLVWHGRDVFDYLKYSDQ